VHKQGLYDYHFGYIRRRVRRPQRPKKNSNFYKLLKQYFRLLRHLGGGLRLRGQDAGRGLGLLLSASANGRLSNHWITPREVGNNVMKIGVERRETNGLKWK
jgi:hypothetical protein